MHVFKNLQNWKKTHFFFINFKKKTKLKISRKKDKHTFWWLCLANNIYDKRL